LETRPQKNNNREGHAIMNDQCAICNNHIETVDNLFLECKTATNTCNLYYKWINIIIVPPNRVTQNFHQFNIPGVRKDGNKIWRTVWMTIVRSI